MTRGVQAPPDTTRTLIWEGFLAPPGSLWEESGRKPSFASFQRTFIPRKEIKDEGGR